MNKLFFIFFLAFLAKEANAQSLETGAKPEKVLTLKECIEIGIENNLSLRTTELNMTKSNYGISESRAKLLPVINAFGNFADNVDKPTMLSLSSKMGEQPVLGQSYAEIRSTRYNTVGGIQFQMPLYSQTIYTGISIATKIKEINQLSFEKAKEDLTVELGKLYYLGQTTSEQLSLIQKNINRLTELAQITQALFDNGIAMEIDVKRVTINLENLQVQRDNVQAMYQQQLNVLKYTLDIPAETSFALEPMGEGEQLTFEGLSHNLYELQLIQSQKELIEKQQTVIKQGYLPSLALVGQLSYTGYNDHFKDYYHSSPFNKWYNAFYWGVSLKIPVFDGFEKHLKLKKTKIESIQIQLKQEDTQKKLETAYQNAMNDWMNNSRNYKKSKDNYLLAEEVYEVTADKYKEGVASMTELLQDEIRMSEAQNNYVSARYSYKLSELSLLKLTQQLNNLSK